MKKYTGTLFKPDWACSPNKTDIQTAQKLKLKQWICKEYGSLLNVKQIIEILPVGKSSVYAAIHAGELIAIHMGRRLVVNVDDFIDYIYKFA